MQGFTCMKKRNVGSSRHYIENSARSKEGGSGAFLGDVELLQDIFDVLKLLRRAVNNQGVGRRIRHDAGLLLGSRPRRGRRSPMRIVRAPPGRVSGKGRGPPERLLQRVRQLRSLAALNRVDEDFSPGFLSDGDQRDSQSQ